MIRIPDELFAANEADPPTEAGAPLQDFAVTLMHAREAAGRVQAEADGSLALHELDRSFDDNETDPSTWAARFEAEAGRIRREVLAGPGTALTEAFARDFDDLAAAKLAVVRRMATAREFDGARTALDNALGTYVEIAADAASDIEARIARDQADAAIARMDQAGFLRAGEAAELHQGFLLRRDAAQLDLLIDTNPDAAAGALADPSRFSALAPEVRMRLKDRAELRAEDVSRTAGLAGLSERQGRRAGLLLRLESGEADRADIMQAVSEGWLKPAERDQASALWNRRRAEIRQRDSDIGRVAAVFAGEGVPLDPTNPDDRRALDVHYTDTKAAWLSAGLTEGQLGPVVADYLGVAKWVPSELRRDVARSFRDGTPEQRLSIAGLLGLLLERIFEWIGNPWGGRPATLDDIFKPDDSPPPSAPPPDDPDPGFEKPLWPDDPPIIGAVPLPMPNEDRWPTWRPDRPILPKLPRSWPRSILDGFEPRDLGEALLINALIDGGWPRGQAPDRAAALMAETLDPKDRFARADRQAFQSHMADLVDTSRLAPATAARIAAATPLSSDAAGTNERASTSGNGSGEATEPPPADALDPGQRARFNNIVAAGAAATTAPDTEAPASVTLIQPEPKFTEEAFLDPGTKAAPGTDSQVSEATSTLVDVANGTTNVSDLPRDENGQVRFGKYLLAEEAAALLEQALRVDAWTAKGLQSQIQANRSLNDAQKGVLLEVLRDRLDQSFLRSGARPRQLESDAVYALRMLDEPRNRLKSDWQQIFAAAGAAPKLHTPAAVRSAPVAAAVKRDIKPRDVPHGFKTKREFDEFSVKLYSGLEEAGHGEAKVFLRGSAATGTSFKTGKPFDSDRRSDFDMAIASAELLEKAKSLGIQFRQNGSRTGPLNENHLRALGLSDLARNLSEKYGRDVTFMIYDSQNSLLARGKAVELLRQK